MHGPDCYKLGPGHYHCALRLIERLQTLSGAAQGKLVRGCDGGMTCWSREKETPRCQLGQGCGCQEACGDDLRAA